MAHRDLEAAMSLSVPHVSMDYGFLGQNDEESIPVIVIRDHQSKTTFTHAVPCKGIEQSKYPARQVAYSIAQLGHARFIFKSDGEPAIIALKREAS